MMELLDSFQFYPIFFPQQQAPKACCFFCALLQKAKSPAKAKSSLPEVCISVNFRTAKRSHPPPTASFLLPAAKNKNNKSGFCILLRFAQSCNVTAIFHTNTSKTAMRGCRETPAYIFHSILLPSIYPTIM